MKTVARLYKTFIPSNYNLFLSPSREKLTFHGTVVITGRKVGRPSQRLTFHQNGLKITSASVIHHSKKGDEPIEIKRINNQKTLHEVRLHSEKMIYPGNYTITMEFEGIITRGMTGLYPCYFTHNGKEHILLATQFESHHAREVFPCIDEPEAKATFDLSLEHEKGLTVIGNMPVKSESRVKSLESRVELQKTSFETTPLMSVYLLAFVIGEMHSKTAKTENGVDVSIWGTIAQPKSSFDFALDVAVRSIEFFEEYFKTPYPLAKADHVALPDFSSGAMENWGLVTYREVALLLYKDAVSQSMKELVATVVAHETSHQWFGNLVTMKWWDDLWLNESFANMMEYSAVDNMFPEWNIWESFITSEGLNALRRDCIPGVQAVKTSVHHPDEISTLFDPSIVYAKGGRLLYMLKQYIGEDDFRTGLQHYFKNNAYKNTCGADLWEALSQASGKDIAAFMNPWLDRSGFPVISIKQKSSQIHVSQKHFLDTPAKIDPDRIWPVPLFASDSLTPELLNTRSAIFESGEKYPLLNTASRGHYLVCYEGTVYKESLIERITNGELSEIDRLMILTNATMLAKAGYDSIADALQILPAFKNETNDTVWDAISVLIADTRRFVDYDEKIEDKLKSLVRIMITSEYKRLGWQDGKHESASDLRQRANIIGLGIYSEEPHVIKTALKMFENYKKDPCSISAELRGMIFSAAAREGVPGAVEFLLDINKTSNSSDLRHDVCAGVTSTRNKKEIKMLLELLTQPKIIKPQDMERWFVNLLRNRHGKELAWQWLLDNWDWVAETFKGDKSFDNFPRYCAIVCNTPEWEAKYHALFEPLQNDPLLKRNIQIGFEEISARIAWLKRDLPSVQTYFKNIQANN